GAGEQFADRREQSTVGSRVRSWRAADGALADVDDAIDELESADALVWRGIPAGAIESICYCLVQRVVDQRGFAGAGHTGDAGHQADRNGDADRLQVVSAGAGDRQLPFRVRLDAPLR